MRRKNWPDTFFEIANIMAQRSTCCKKQVGAVITKDNKIISCGYNGVVSGAEHCTGVLYDKIIRTIRGQEGSAHKMISPEAGSTIYFYDISFGKELYRVKVPSQVTDNPNRHSNDIVDYIYKEVIEKDYIKSWHSEWSLKNEIHAELNAIFNASQSLEGTTLYVTLSPCIECAKAIVASGIKKVYFNGPDRSEKPDDGARFMQQHIDVYHII